MGISKNANLPAVGFLDARLAPRRSKSLLWDNVSSLISPRPPKLLTPLRSGADPRSMWGSARSRPGARGVVLPKTSPFVFGGNAGFSKTCGFCPNRLDVYPSRRPPGAGRSNNDTFRAKRYTFWGTPEFPCFCFRPESFLQEPAQQKCRKPAERPRNENKTTGKHRVVLKRAV